MMTLLLMRIVFVLVDASPEGLAVFIYLLDHVSMTRDTSSMTRNDAFSSPSFIQFIHVTRLQTKAREVFARCYCFFINGILILRKRAQKFPDPRMCTVRRGFIRIHLPSSLTLSLPPPSILHLSPISGNNKIKTLS